MIQLLAFAALLTLLACTLVVFCAVFAWNVLRELPRKLTASGSTDAYPSEPRSVAARESLAGH